MPFAALLRYRDLPVGIEVSDSLAELYSAREKLALGRIATYEGNFERARRFYEYALIIAPGDTLTTLYLDDLLATIDSAYPQGPDAR